MDQKNEIYSIKKSICLCILLYSMLFLFGCKFNNESNVSISQPEDTPSPTAQVSLPVKKEEEKAEFSDNEISLESKRGPLVINEIVVSNVDTYPRSDGEFKDWVEIKNISDDTVNLSDYFLSDKNKNRLKFRLPDVQLQSGGLALIYCDDEEDLTDSAVHASFSISADGERLWLSDEQENVVDYANIADVPIGGSYGRMDEDLGWFYFAVPSPGGNNQNGLRAVCSKPSASLPSGQYNGVDSITVELSSEFGDIYYSLDGNAPGKNAILYTEPIVITETTVIQAVTVADGAHTSRLAVFNYFVNENHSLPILAYNAEVYDAFLSLYNNPNKIYHTDCVGALSLYENGEELFNQRCGLRMKGFSSLIGDPKKNMAAYFRGKYGDGDIEGIDIFGNGITEYSSIAFRSGQDQYYASMRNEIAQELCLQFTDAVPTQHNKYVVLYVNGNYWGLYALKENMNEHYYASLKNVSSDSVSVFHKISDLAKEGDAIYEAISFCLENDMADPEMYEKFSAMFDIDNLVDYFVLYSYFGNTDTLNNVRYFMSPEEDGKWRFSFYDMDKSMQFASWAVNNVFNYLGQSHQQLSDMANKLCETPVFREKFLTRYAEAVNTVLTDENVLRQIDILYEQIKPEMARDRAKWGSSESYWEGSVDNLRALFRNGYTQSTVNSLCDALDLTEEERIKYFG